jgi:hypothetical protein
MTGDLWIDLAVAVGGAVVGWFGRHFLGKKRE